MLNLKKLSDIYSKKLSLQMLLRAYFGWYTFKINSGQMQLLIVDFKEQGY